MAGNQGANQYKTMSIKTANRGQLLLMLYEAAIQSIKRAIDAMDKQDLATKGTSIGKAHDIVNELLNTLNFDVGGQVALDLERLYNYIIEQLMRANAENNREPLAACQKILENLLSAWRVAVSEVNKGTAK